MLKLGRLLIFIMVWGRDRGRFGEIKMLLFGDGRGGERAKKNIFVDGC